MVDMITRSILGAYSGFHQAFFDMERIMGAFCYTFLQVRTREKDARSLDVDTVKPRVVIRLTLNLQGWCVRDVSFGGRVSRVYPNSVP